MSLTILTCSSEDMSASMQALPVLIDMEGGEQSLVPQTMETTLCSRSKKSNDDHPPKPKKAEADVSARASAGPDRTALEKACPSEGCFFRDKLR